MSCYHAGTFKVHTTDQPRVICLESITHKSHFVHCSEDSFIIARVGRCYW